MSFQGSMGSLHVCRVYGKGISSSAYNLLTPLPAHQFTPSSLCVGTGGKQCGCLVHKLLSRTFLGKVREEGNVVCYFIALRY